jgi:hypothetical protein
MLQIAGLAALSAGIVVAFLMGRVPKRGWVGVMLLLVASGAWSLIDSAESSRPSSLSMFVTFLFVAPVAIVYSFLARRSAPDRIVALAAFIGACVVLAFLLFMMAGLIYSLFVV